MSNCTKALQTCLRYTFAMPTPHLTPNATGHLSVGDGHTLYYEDWGNPDATPIFCLHGGPGSGFSDKMKTLFDPRKHRVIFHDQRGAGKSTPFASVDHNTSQDLVEDIERLRAHLGIERMHVVGGSWGSTLALLYAIAHPERVTKLLLWSVFLARKFEVDMVNDGTLRTYFPEAWDRFIALVPEAHRENGDTVMRYYAEKVRSTDPAEAKRHADEWALWECTLLSIGYNPIRLEKEVLEDRDNAAVASIETHYFLNGCFVPENHILSSIDAIKDIPCVLIHGRFDMCTPPVSAHDLSQAYGSNLSLVWVNSGHTNGDPEMNAAIRTAAQTFLT